MNSRLRRAGEWEGDRRLGSVNKYADGCTGPVWVGIAMRY